MGGAQSSHSFTEWKCTHSLTVRWTVHSALISSFVIFTSFIELTGREKHIKLRNCIIVVRAIVIQSTCTSWLVASVCTLECLSIFRKYPVSPSGTHRSSWFNNPWTDPTPFGEGCFILFSLIVMPLPGDVKEIRLVYQSKWFSMLMYLSYTTELASLWL